MCAQINLINPWHMHTGGLWQSCECIMWILLKMPSLFSGDRFISRRLVCSSSDSSCNSTNCIIIVTVGYQLCYSYLALLPTRSADWAHRLLLCNTVQQCILMVTLYNTAVTAAMLLAQLVHLLHVQTSYTFVTLVNYSHSAEGLVPIIDIHCTAWCHMCTSGPVHDVIR